MEKIEGNFELQSRQHLNPKQAGLFANWYGRRGGAESAPLYNFCLGGPIDLTIWRKKSEKNCQEVAQNADISIF